VVWIVPNISFLVIKGFLVPESMKGGLARRKALIAGRVLGVMKSVLLRNATYGCHVGVQPLGNSKLWSLIKWFG
jgi:hypothetical protein